ncbi:MAG: hypothetical protein JNK59_12670, partial [Sterolibacteriaceae bacterium]|nr:hypothetical protein [Sterolibacteriaceae bacterium]
MRTVTLTGTPGAGEVWSFVINGKTATYTVLAEDLTDGNEAALARIASKLAQYINDRNDIPLTESDDFLGLSAAASGARIVITGTLAAFTVGSFTPAAGNFAVVAVASGTRNILSGGVTEGDTWTVRLVTGVDAVANFSHVVALVDADGDPATPGLRLPTLAEIAAALAGKINSGASGGFLAIAEGSTLVVINQVGTSFTTGLSVAPASVIAVSRSFELQGTVTAGDAWTVTLSSGGVATSVSVTTGSTLASVATALGGAINGTAGYKATVNGTTLIISTKGAIAGKAFALNSTSPAGAVVEKAVTTTRELAVFGPAVVGDVWTVTVTAGGVTSSVSVPVTGDLATLAANLATQINLLTGFTGSVSGSVITVATAGANASKALTVSYGVVRNFADDSSDPAPSTIGAAHGAPVAGETWRVTVAGVDHDHVVTANQTLADVMAALAQRITNASAFDAASRGETIVILGSASFAIPARVNGAVNASAASYNGGTVTISGTPKAGETITLNLGATTHVHVVRATVPLAEIAAGLAARLHAAGIEARVEGDSLVLVSGLGSSFSIPSASTAGSATRVVESASTVRYTLAGTSRIGETWRVTVGGADYDYVVESPTVIAGILAADINAAGYVVRASVTPLAPAAPTAGELWTVKVDLGATTLTVGYAAVSGDSISRVMAGLASALNAAGNTQFVAQAVGADLLLVNRTALMPAVEFKRGTTSLAPTVSVDANRVASTENGTIVIVPLAGGFTAAGAAAAVAARNSLTMADATVVTVAPTATPVEGESWRVTIGSGLDAVLYSHVVQRVGGSVQTAAEIAAILAGKITTGAVTGYTAFADGGVLVITRTDNTTIGATSFVVTPAAGIVVDAATPTSRIVSFGAAGAAIQGESWYILIDTADGVFAYSHTVQAGDSVSAIALALAHEINTDGAGGFTAYADARQLFIVDRSGRSFAAHFEVALADGRRGGAAELLVPASVHDITLGGTAEVGEDWTIELETSDGLVRSYGHRVVSADFLNSPVPPSTTPTPRTPTEILAALAAELAAAINADQATGFTAFADGVKLIVTQREGISFDAEGVIVPKLRAAGSVTVVGGKAAEGGDVVPAIEVNLVNGIPVTGAHWMLQLQVDGVTYDFDHAVATAQPWPSIAAGFAAAINAAAVAGSPLSGLTATLTDGDTLLIADLGGRRLAGSVVLVPVAQSAIDGGSATTTMVDLIGTPLAGEPWRLRIGELMYEVKLGDLVNLVTLGDADNAVTLAEFAAALAWKLNADSAAARTLDPEGAAARYTAFADGARIIVVDREGGIFETLLEAGTITRAKGYADIQLDYNLDAAQMQARLQALYGFDDVSVAESRNDGDVSYTISFVRDEAGVDLPQIAWVETAQTTGLLPSPNASVDVATATVRNGALVNAGVNNLQTININPNVTGGTFTVWFRIENERGEYELAESAPIAYNASAIDVFKALSPILNPNGATIDIDEAFDQATRITSRPYTDNFAVREVDGVFVITFQGEHRYLTIHDIDTRLLLTQETGTDNE